MSDTPTYEQLSFEATLMSPLSQSVMNDLFSPTEQQDIRACARERGVQVFDLMHDAVIGDLFR